jgi:hypothetical protein
LAAAEISVEGVMEEKRELIQLELKYCERCGGLWFRLKESPEVYCASCAVAMAEVASSVPRSKRHPRLPVAEDFEANSPVEGLAWMEAGNA